MYIRMWNHSSIPTDFIFHMQESYVELLGLA